MILKRTERFKGRGLSGGGGGAAQLIGAVECISGMTFLSSRIEPRKVLVIL